MRPTRTTPDDVPWIVFRRMSQSAITFSLLPKTSKSSPLLVYPQAMLPLLEVPITKEKIACVLKFILPVAFPQLVELHDQLTPQHKIVAVVFFFSFPGTFTTDGDSDLAGIPAAPVIGFIASALQLSHSAHAFSQKQRRRMSSRKPERCWTITRIFTRT